MDADTTKPRRPVPSPEACMRAWKDLVDLGYEMALANLLRLGKTREEAWKIIAGWVDRDNQDRLEAIIHAFGGRASDGE